MSVLVALALAIAGALFGIALSGFGFGRWVSEESFRGYLRRIAARRDWPWLLEACTIGESMQRERIARHQVEMLGACVRNLKAITHHKDFILAPAAHVWDQDQIVLIDVEELDGVHSPVALVLSGGGRPWKLLPLAEATPAAILEAMGPIEDRGGPEFPVYQLRAVLARAKDEELQKLPGPMKTALIHSLLRDEDIPGAVEGLVDRHQRGRAVAS